MSSKILSLFRRDIYHASSLEDLLSKLNKVTTGYSLTRRFDDWKCKAIVEGGDCKDSMVFESGMYCKTPFEAVQECLNKVCEGIDDLTQCRSEIKSD